jgi:multidrug transporter EmrE-like cation transporter
MDRVYLVIAILLEVTWAIGMKLSKGFTLRVPSVITVITYIASLVFLSLATRKAEVGASYAIWAGCGAALIAIVSFTYFHEPVTAVKVISIALIVAGVVGLNLQGAPH